jgi:hypothetical protein
VFDEQGKSINTLEMIGKNSLFIVRNILFLKEKIDEERGLRMGICRTQNIFKKTLGI